MFQSFYIYLVGPKTASVVKKLLLTSVVMILASYTFAQGISGGVKAGLNPCRSEVFQRWYNCRFEGKTWITCGVVSHRNDQ
jgi:hypothetical protein